MLDTGMPSASTMGGPPPSTGPNAFGMPMLNWTSPNATPNTGSTIQQKLAANPSAVADLDTAPGASVGGPPAGMPPGLVNRPTANPALGAMPGRPTPFGAFRSVGQPVAQPSYMSPYYGGMRTPTQQAQFRAANPLRAPATKGAPNLASMLQQRRPAPQPSSPSQWGFGAMDINA